MRILIFTSGKTGSSALAGTLQKSLPDHELVFEPARLETISDEKPNLIVKSLAALHYGTEVHKFPSYDKRIFLTRHPFDRLVSALLYAPYNGGGFEKDENACSFLELLERKVASPKSVSFLSICERFRELGGFDVLHFVGEELRCHCEFSAQYGDEFFTLSYEDLIAGRREGLERYLGIQLKQELSVPAGFERVNRSGGSGDWKKWFLEEDRISLETRWREYFTSFPVYSANLEMDVEPTISRDTSFEYVLRMINLHRSDVGLPLCNCS
ncbi:hypothetical protein [Pelagicoccus sp. SDUM812005]|uniref:hypothetical protein n=1 Tax=Pelagicoccus sp. SDUM812005 TaxID=3041257 RepID=UPI00280DE126|nr:hypothetical protein [Pelagicoccus sp. SDUM812005]MDQ8182382.1 hypothetical protein [Pelagicoccus sp. SDUM812005]